MQRPLFCLALVAGLLVGCSDAAETTAPPRASESATASRQAPSAGPRASAEATPSATPPGAALPTDDALVAALLSSKDLGAGFTGGAPIVEPRGGTAVDEPVCDIPRTTSRLAAVSTGPMVASKTDEQVRQQLTVSSDAAADLVVTRGRAAARCTYEEVAGEITSVVAVEGPVDLTDVSADAAGLARTYSGGYDWHRWDMDVRAGRVLIHVEYTSASPIVAARAREILGQAVAKAARLR